MRHVLAAGIVPVLLGALSEARAAPPEAADSHLRPLVISELPEQCRELGRVPASALIPDPDVAAHVSVANCWAEQAMGQLALRPDPASIAALDAAAAPSLQILDDVIEHGAPRWQVIADTAKADLYRGMVVRMRNAIPGGNAPASLEASLTTWLDSASKASRAAAEIARHEPVGDDPVVRSALASLVAADDSPPGPAGVSRSTARATVNLLDPGLVRTMHRAIIADLRVIRDREQRDAAQAEIADDTRRIVTEAQRSAALEIAWHRAVAGGEPSEAATLMRAHADAVRDERLALASLAQARSSFETARTQVALDRQHLRDVEAREQPQRERLLLPPTESK